MLCVGLLVYGCICGLLFGCLSVCVFVPCCFFAFVLVLIVGDYGLDFAD